MKPNLRAETLSLARKERHLHEIIGAAQHRAQRQTQNVAQQVLGQPALTRGSGTSVKYSLQLFIYPVVTFSCSAFALGFALRSKTSKAQIVTRLAQREREIVSVKSLQWIKSSLEAVFKSPQLDRMGPNISLTLSNSRGCRSDRPARAARRASRSAATRLRRRKAAGLSLIDGEATLGADLWGSSEASWLLLHHGAQPAVLALGTGARTATSRFTIRTVRCKRHCRNWKPKCSCRQAMKRGLSG